MKKRGLILPGLALLLMALQFYGCGKPAVNTGSAQSGKQPQVKTKIEGPKDIGVQPQDISYYRKPVEYLGGIPSYPLHRLPEYSYPDFSQDVYGKGGLKRALKFSRDYYCKIPRSTKFYFGDDRYDAGHMLLSIDRFLQFLDSSPSPYDIDSFVRRNYLVYTTVKTDSDRDAAVQKSSVCTPQRSPSSSLSSSPDGIDLSVMFTGYYEPSMAGSLVKDGEYKYPIYSKPNDLIEVPRGGFTGKYKGAAASGARKNGKNELVPYYTRAEIDSMPDFDRHAEPIAWVNNRIDRFFMEIQGSGRIDLKQGGFLRVQYHAKNGRPYRSIGRYLIDKGEIPKEEISMQSIRKWLDDHPSRVDEVLNHNPSFVFFRKGERGPVGCLGVEVTQMRSIATDKGIFPKGALCFMETTIPSWESRDNNIAWKNYAAFVMNQDTGGAIKGSGRADYFYGNGHYAELAAGNMQQLGRLYFLVLK